MNVEKQGKVYTREELEEHYDNEVLRLTKQWGKGYFYPEQAKKRKVENLAKFDSGEAVFVRSEEYHENQMDWSDDYYSDGTVKTVCYDYSD